MYQALYRKYRPSNFEEIAGQNIIVKTIKNSIINNRISHAYLFCGPRGTGKTTLAKIIAKTVNCENIKNGVACDKCESCLQFNNKTTTDIIEIDAASNNGVDEIREIRNNVNLVPSIGKYKVYIIDEVHMLTVSAFNALLKTLEEPPQHIIFILATTEPYKIPSTILSRCQRFDFKKISNNQIIERLKYIIEKEKINIEENAIEEIAHSSDGGMRDAISLLDQAIAYTDNDIKIDNLYEINGSISKEEIHSLIENILNKNVKEIFQKIKIYDENGKNLIKLTEEIMIFFKNILLNRCTKDYFDSNEINLYTFDTKKISNELIIKCIDELNNTLIQMKNSNYLKILLEVCFIKMINFNENNELEKKLDIKNEKIELNNKNNSENKITKENNNNEDKIDSNKLNELKNLRINNTLANFKKIYLNEVKENIDQIKKYIFDDDYSDIASIILDGNIKAASDKNIIFVYDNDWQSKEFNKNIINIENLLNKIYKKKYKIISTDSTEWEQIKQNFNSKKFKYNYKEESDDILDFLLIKERNEIEQDFSDIIKYE